MKCAEPGCEAETKDHYWAKVKAHDPGWFARKDGTAWCPLHNPAWVGQWRAQQREARA